jgi:hypothetical protein
MFIRVTVSIQCNKRREQMKKLITCTIAAAALSLGAIGMASAQPILAFDQASDNEGGTLSWDGPHTAFTGSNIIFDQVTGTDTPQHDGSTLHFTNGSLDFELGDYTGKTTSGSQIIATFGSGGSFTLSGDYGGTSYPDIVKGSWDGATVTYNENTGDLSIIGSGFDTKTPDLLAYFGLDSDADFTFSNSELSAKVDYINTDTGELQATVTESDLTNKMSVPEPAALGLFGLALVMLGVALRYRQRSDS